MEFQQLTVDFLPDWVVISAAICASTLCMLLVKRFILGRIRLIIDKTSYAMDTILLNSVSAPLTFIVFAINIYFLQILLSYYEIKADKFAAYISPISKLLIVVAIILFVDRFCVGFIGAYAGRTEVMRSSRSIVQGVARGLILGVGILIFLGTLGISITPILASLGITSLAVALALQPTLENFFSGVQLVIDKPIRVGDFIELDSGEQGFVEQIGWRSTWIKMLPNNTIIMPNSTLSQSKIINYFYPEKELSVPVDVGVHYDSDLEHVEKVTLEVAREILISHEWGVDDYNTFVVFHTFDNSSINFTVMLRAKEYFNRFWVKSAFIKALHKRYAEEGIVIPYPISAINLNQEQAHIHLNRSANR